MRCMPCEVYSRIVGYFRPVRQWNKGKQQEYAERVSFRVDADEQSRDVNNASIRVFKQQ